MMNSNKLFVLLTFSLTISACDKLQPVKVQTTVTSPAAPDPMSSLTETQREFQKAVLSLPIIPFEVFGTREEEKYSKQLTTLHEEWDDKIGKSIENWECSVVNVDNLSRHISCVGIGTSHSSIESLNPPLSRPEKIYIGDKLLVSGDIDKLDIELGMQNPKSQYNVFGRYTMYLNNSIFKLKE
jgi:hypothetical protein